MTARGLRRAAAGLAVVLGVGVLGAGPVAAGTGGGAKAPNLVGTWEGPYSYPSPDGVVHHSNERLVVDTQDGAALWGHDVFVDKDGVTQEIPVYGTVVGRDVGFAEAGGVVTGRLVDRRHMVLRFFITGTRPTSFHVSLTRTSR